MCCTEAMAYCSPRCRHLTLYPMAQTHVYSVMQATCACDGRSLLQSILLLLQCSGLLLHAPIHAFTRVALHRQHGPTPSVSTFARLAARPVMRAHSIALGELAPAVKSPMDDSTCVDPDSSQPGADVRRSSADGELERPSLRMVSPFAGMLKTSPRWCRHTSPDMEVALLCKRHPSRTLGPCTPSPR